MTEWRCSLIASQFERVKGPREREWRQLWRWRRKRRGKGYECVQYVSGGEQGTSERERGK